MSRMTPRNVHVQDQALAAVSAITAEFNRTAGERVWITTDQVRQAVGITNRADMAVWRALDRLARRGRIARCEYTDPAYLGVPALWRLLPAGEVDALEALWAAATAEEPTS